jgi:hypothetical protein
MNTLTGEAGLKLGPLLLETLLKHYFERLGQSASQKEQDTTVPLRKEDLLYDEAFQIVKVRCIPMFHAINTSNTMQIDVYGCIN